MNKENFIIKSTQTYKSVYALMMPIFIAVIAILGVVIVVLVVSHKSERNYLLNSMIVIDNGGNITKAQIKDSKQTRLYEFKNHIRMFFHSWYELDFVSYDQKIEQGLKLVDVNVGKKLLIQYDDAELKKNLQIQGIQTTVMIDSIRINNTIPVTGVAYAKQVIEKSNSIITRYINFEFGLEQVQRSELNPHGVLINNWSAISTEVISNEAKGE